MHILVVADAAFCANLADQFARAGVDASIHAARAAALPGAADAIIVDACVAEPAPIVARLRREGFASPIILIAESPLPPCPGVDMTLRRPLKFSELRAALAAAEPRIGPWLLRGQNLIASDARQAALRLTEKEAAILARLARAPGRPVARADLLRDVWGYGPDLPTRALEAQIYRLRRKLEPDPRRPRLLLTAPEGYRLAAID